MELHNRNQTELLPYEKLAVLGIDREKADNLPVEVKEKLVSGRSNAYCTGFYQYPKR